MVTTGDVTAIFADARAMHAEALRQFELGDVRDAAEKAWCATKRATDALILARTGSEPMISSATTRGIALLAENSGAADSLLKRYFTRQSHLHGTCFYLGVFEPLAETERRIRQTADYINDAENLAGVN